MKLGSWITALGCFGMGGIGVSAALVIQGCTTAATVCTGECGRGSNAPLAGDDAGATHGEDSGAALANDAAGGGLGETPIDTGSTPPNSCNTCLYGQCIGSYSNCVGNASCLAIYQCVTSPTCAADGGNCIDACYDAGTATAQALYLALDNCDQTAQCANLSANPPCAACSPSPAACAVDDAGAEADEAGPDRAEDAGVSSGSAPPCSACQSSICGSELAACAVGTECAAYNQCLGGCSDATCDTACTSAFSAGASSAQALGACTTSGCSQCFD